MVKGGLALCCKILGSEMMFTKECFGANQIARLLIIYVILGHMMRLPHTQMMYVYEGIASGKLVTMATITLPTAQIHQF